MLMEKIATFFAPRARLVEIMVSVKAKDGLGYLPRRDWVARIPCVGEDYPSELGVLGFRENKKVKTVQHFPAVNERWDGPRAFIVLDFQD